MAEATSDLENWKTEAKSLQGQFVSSLGTRIWDAYKLPEDTSYLWMKIATALYGHPNININSEEEKRVGLIRDKCIKYSKAEPECVHMAVIFTFVYKKGELEGIVPVFRVRRQKEEVSNVSKYYFIDHMGTHYRNWKQYLNKRIWKMCWLCVPKGGLYSYCDPECVEFLDQSKRGSFIKAVDKGCKTAESFANKALKVGMLLTFIPPAAPVGIIIDMVASAVKSFSWIYKGIRWVGGGQNKCNLKAIAYRDKEATKEKWVDKVDGNLSKVHLTESDIQEFKNRVFFLMHTVIDNEVSYESFEKFTETFPHYLDIFDRLQGKESTGVLPAVEERDGNAQFARKITNIGTVEELIKNSNDLDKNKQFITGPKEFNENSADLFASKKSIIHPQDLIKDSETLSNVEEFIQPLPEPLPGNSHEMISEPLQLSVTKTDSDSPNLFEKLDSSNPDSLSGDLIVSKKSIILPQDLIKDSETLSDPEEFIKPLPEPLPGISHEMISEPLQLSVTKTDTDSPNLFEKLNSSNTDSLLRLGAKKWLLLLIPPAILLLTRLRH